MGKGKLASPMTMDHRIYVFKESRAQAAAAGDLGKGDCPSSQLTLASHKAEVSTVAVALGSFLYFQSWRKVLGIIF